MFLTVFTSINKRSLTDYYWQNILQELYKLSQLRNEIVPIKVCHIAFVFPVEFITIIQLQCSPIINIIVYFKISHTQKSLFELLKYKSTPNNYTKFVFLPNPDTQKTDLYKNGHTSNIISTLLSRGE